MIDYIIRYTNSGSAGAEAASAGSTSTDITVSSTPGETYTISVEARSEHLSGESATMTITIGEYHNVGRRDGADARITQYIFKASKLTN